MTRFNQSFTPEKNTSNFARKMRKFSKPVLVLFIAAFVLSAVVFYLLQVNEIATQGFYVRDLEQQISSAKDENAKLQIRMIEMKSMTDLSEKVEQLGMVRVDKMTYYDTSGQVVAVR